MSGSMQHESSRRTFLNRLATGSAAIVAGSVALNLDAARKYFPDTLRMLPAGLGDENPRGGNDNSLIPKLAAQYRARMHRADAAAGCLGIEVLRNVERRDEFVVISRWSDRQSYDAWRRGPLFREAHRRVPAGPCWVEQSTQAAALLWSDGSGATQRLEMSLERLRRLLADGVLDRPEPT